MKKLLAILLTAIMLFGMTPALADDPVEIEFGFGLGGKLGEVFLGLIDEYNASQDKVHVTGVQFPDHSSVMKELQASLAAKNPMACLLVTEFGMLEDYLEPLNERYESDVDFNAADVLAGAVDCMYDLKHERILGVPMYATMQVMYYRLDMFEGYDIDETFKNWQNLAKACAEITQRDEQGNTTVWGWMPMKGSNNLHDAVMCAGGSFYTDDTMRTAAFDTQPWKDVCSSFYKWVHEDKIMDLHFGGTGWEYWYATIDDVLAGKAAGYTGSVADQGDLDFTVVGAYNQPSWEDTGLGAHTNAHRGVIPKGNSQERQDAAWDFLKFLSGGSSQAKIAINGGYVPVRRSALEAPEMVAYMEANPQAKALVDAVGAACADWVDVTGGYLWTVTEDLADRILLEGVDPEEALAIAQEEAQAYLDAYWEEQD